MHGAAKKIRQAANEHRMPFFVHLKIVTLFLLIIDEPYISFYFDTAYITVGIGLEEDACGLECKSMEKYLVKQKAFLSPQISAQEVNSFPSFISSLFAA